MPPFFSGPFEDTGRRQSLIYLRWLKNLLSGFLMMRLAMMVKLNLLIQSSSNGSSANCYRMPP